MEKKVRVIPKYKTIFQNPKRYNLLWGGRGRGGTTALVQYIFSRLYSEQYARIAFMRYISVDIKDSIQKELEDFIREIEVTDLENKNREYIQPNGNLIALKSFKTSENDNTAKIKGLAKFNIIAIDELDQLSEYDFMQLDASLRENDAMIVATFNPPEKGHWIWKRFFTLKHAEIDGYYNATPNDDITAIFSTYEDNHFLPENYRAVMKGYENTNLDYYLNQIKGLIPSGKTGIIFKNWKEVPDKEFFDLPYSSSFGLDFGFSNDPAAIVEVKKHNNKVWVHEHLYTIGMTNEDIFQEVKRLGIKDQITADSAEPKSIEELTRKGLFITGARKGKDSVREGIDKLLSSEVFYTSSSRNIKEEILNYTWKLDKFKEPTNEPADKYNHCFVGDTIITTKSGDKMIKDIEEREMVLTRNGFKKVLRRWYNGKKQIEKFSLLFDTFSIELECTFSHKIWTSLGWIKISELKSGMTVCLSKSSMARFSDYIQDKSISHVEQKECMLSYGSTIMVKEKKDSIFTTKTATLGTIESKTLNQLKEESIFQRTQESFTGKIQTSQERTSKKIKRNAESGTQAKKEENGTQNTQRKTTLDHSNMEKKSVIFADQSLQKKHTTQDFAQINVNQHGEENQESTKKKDNAFFVKNRLESTDTHVLCVVREVARTDAGVHNVFDLAVEECHEYFANGILVHNCIDATRYAMEEKDEPNIDFL